MKLLPTAGPVGPTDEFYVDRPLVQEIIDLLLRGTDVSLVGGWQTGKTTALLGLRARAKSIGAVTSLVDLSTFGSVHEPAEWYAHFAAQVRGRSDPEAAGAGDLAPPSDHTDLERFLDAIVLASDPKSLFILMLDELTAIPMTLQVPFFSAIRAIQNKRQDPAASKRVRALRFVFAGTFSPDQLLADSNNSPFNISAKIDTSVRDFTAEEVHSLIAKSGATANADEIHAWTGGHPYLTNSLIEAFDETGTIDAAVALLISRSPHFGHLARVLSGLGPGAIGASLKIGDGSDSRPFLRGLDEVLDRIATIGLVKSNGAGNTIIRCKLYARFLERVGQVLAGSEGNSSEVSNATAIVPEMVDAAIITALEEELNALLLVAGNSSKVDLPGFNGRTYYRMTTPGGKTVVAVRAFGMGQVNAAVLATAITQSFAPGILLLTGIAGGINKVALGDVVVSDQIIDYELGKEMPGVQERRPQVYRASANLIDIAKRSSMAEQGAPWHQMIGVERPDGTAVSPAVHIGDVLCGNKVIADEAVVKALAAPWPSSRAIEMESSGVAAAIHQGGSEIPFLMVKGVSDLADAKKTNTPWRPYAARAAAAFVLAIVDAV